MAPATALSDSAGEGGMGPAPPVSQKCLQHQKPLPHHGDSGVPAGLYVVVPWLVTLGSTKALPGGTAEQSRPRSPCLERGGRVCRPLLQKEVSGLACL